MACWIPCYQGIRIAMLFPALCLFASAMLILAEDEEIPGVEPEHLDMLLRTQRYEEFAKLMGIESVELVRPTQSRSSDRKPMFNKALPYGDFYIRKGRDGKARQGLNFYEYPDNKWPNGVVPFAISNEYDSRMKKLIRDSVVMWNREVDCIEWIPRTRQKAFVYFYPGDGCFSAMGRTGAQQGLSLDPNGCDVVGIAIHEMDHAVGMAHEHNRVDRDKYVKVLYENIPEKWHSQYEKLDPYDYELIDKYDYYSIMHYDMLAPDTDGKKAFRILKKGINESMVGQTDGFTDTDLLKIEYLYCDDRR